MVDSIFTKVLLALVLLTNSTTNAQDISGSELLEKAISYHDPQGHWKDFHNTLEIRMETPNKPDRLSSVMINLPKDHFRLVAERDSTKTLRVVNKGVCSFALNDRTNLSDEEIKTHGLTCERAKVMKNYYTYLYGLPMKLTDPGTHIDQRVERRSFNGKEYLVLKATYDAKVGNDTWYFYFDPITFAMEVYQFYHDETKNDGEYILLEDIEIIDGIKMPKNRKWYTNGDQKWLGTDFLLHH